MSLKISSVGKEQGSKSLNRQPTLKSTLQNVGTSMKDVSFTLLAVLLFAVSGWTTPMFQLSGFCCNPFPLILNTPNPLITTALINRLSYICIYREREGIFYEGLRVFSIRGKGLNPCLKLLLTLFAKYGWDNWAYRSEALQTFSSRLSSTRKLAYSQSQLACRHRDHTGTCPNYCSQTEGISRGTCTQAIL